MAKGNLDASVLPSLDPSVYKMLANPLRYQIVMKLGEAPASPSTLAEALDESIKRVSEAIDSLVKGGLVELVEKRPGPKGGIVHLYRATRHVFDPDEWAQLPQAQQQAASFAITRVLFNQVARALESGSFDSHSHRVLIRRPLWVDDQGVERVDSIMIRADEEIAEVEKEAALRMSESGEQPIRLVTGQLSFPVDSDNWSSCTE